MVLKLFGLNKKSEYFLEAEPLSKNGSEPAAKAEPAESTPAAAPVSESAEVPTVKDTSAAEAPAPEVPEPTANAAATASAPAQPKAKKMKKAPAAAEAAPPAAQPAAAKAAPVAQPTVKTFATDYLIPQNTPRRRPGPSMEIFRTMAKEVGRK